MPRTSHHFVLKFLVELLQTAVLFKWKQTLVKSHKISRDVSTLISSLSTPMSFKMYRAVNKLGDDIEDGNNSSA